MVVIDATTLMLLFHPTAKPPLDELTGEPLTKCKERIELLLQNLSKGGIQVMVPTPVLSEILVTSGADKARILAEINNAYAFKIQPFDMLAAVEVAVLTDPDLQSNKVLTEDETKAKVKFDRQIIAIAKVAGVKTIYSDDGRLGKKAAANGITVVKTSDLPLPPEPPQGELPLQAQKDDEEE
ncbi:hypothetical protein B0E46_03955 [Rhodanobacter sp. B04]|uniref:hypothetical protein n=1 Tax=Rhodanobacter sp. B04 TaxID=1945860 RepID=UPI000985CB9C|nr:hypothetical protein [Rhodanobacter sp. B04]OOG65508.1 hypothetical protein B0E46_03955 [Rhodanobacter sp. B04]